MASTKQDELLTFQEQLDFNSFLLQHVFDGSTESLEQSRVRIVGQEKDGSVLFAWDSFKSTQAQEPQPVSHVGLYSPSSPSYRVLHTHKELRDICDASVSPDRSLLAFTVRERESTWVFTYDTLVAEIQPQGRVFSLNLSSGDFRKVQFIYPSSSGRHPKQLPQPRLLVIIPEHWVCLYSFQMEPVERGYVTLTQPEHTILTKEFPWYQWDAERQWLYYARFEMLQTSSVHPQSSLVLYCIGFGGGTMSSTGSLYQVILTISLQVPYRQLHYLGVATYYESPLAFCIPVRELNMQVLHNKTGLWCVCLQHKDGRPPSQPQSRNPQLRSVEPPEVKLEYSVYLVHNGHVLEGQVILPGPVSTGHLLQFMLLGCYVVAYVPGVCLHILNVGAHTDPCHHLVLEAKDSPTLPRATGTSVPSASTLQPQPTSFTSPSEDQAILSPAISSLKLSDFSTAIFHNANNVFYTCSLNPSGFMNLFMRTSDQKQQQGLLHLMLVGFRLYVNALKMVEHICQTPMTIADSQIFSEFIVAFSYSSMVPDSRQYILRQIPLTTAMIFRGGVYKKEDGSNYALLKCNEIQDFVKQLLVQSDQRLVSASNDTIYSFTPNSSDAFDVLCYTNVLSQQTKRINLEDMAAHVPAEQLASPQQVSGPGRRKSSKPQRTEKTSSSLSETLNVSLMGRITRFIQSPKTVDSHDILPDLPSFLKRDDDLEPELLSQAMNMREYIIRVMAVGIKQNLKAIVTAGENYWAELQRSSLILLRIIWQSLGFSDANDPLLSSIHRSPLPQEQALLELLEAYYITHNDLGIPVPSGFPTLFICMGYLCLEPSVFLQYMSNGVFTPTKRFLQLLFRECNEVDPEYLFEIVAFLEEDLAEMARMLWNNPVLEHFLTRRQHFA